MNGALLILKQAAEHFRQIRSLLHGRFPGGNIFHENKEFIASDTAHHITLAHHFFHAIGHFR